ncbi:MAG: ABC transporter permease [Acidobacteriota bacterium]
MPSRPPLAERALSWLLVAYPPLFRARFAAGMHQSLLREHDAARSRGRASHAAFWILTVGDIIRFAAAQRVAEFRHPPRAEERGPRTRPVLSVDWRDAWRSLRAAPLITAIAVLSLGLGIGANTALFSILNSLVLKSLPVRDPGRLMLVDHGSWTNPIWEEIRAHERDISDGAFAWAAETFDLSSRGETDPVEGIWASGRLFEVLGVPAIIGRTFTSADDARGGGPDGPVAVISYDLWQRRFGGGAGVIGRTLVVERVPFTIIGVTPRGFFGPDVGRSYQVAIPIVTLPLVGGKGGPLDGRSSWWLEIMLRLKPGQSEAQATAMLSALQPQIRAATLPADLPAPEQPRYLSDPLKLLSAASGRSPLRSRYEAPLTAIMVVVGIVLLIACANIASLQLARGAARRRELTLRVALGASRFRIVRQLLAESLMLAGAGALLGLAVAGAGSRLVVAQLSTMANPVYLDLSFDWRVLGFTTLVTITTAVLFGLALAAGVRSIAPNEALKEHARGSSDRRLGARQFLVVAQVALSLALVVGAGLFGRTFFALATRASGFERGSVLIATVNVQKSGASAAARPELFERLRVAAAGVPAVRSAAVSFTTPVGDTGWNTGITVPPGSTLTRRERTAWINAVSPEWFDTYGMRRVAGRDFDGRDKPGAPLAAIVNRAFVLRFLTGEAIGARFTQAGRNGTSYEVVGVVEDAVYRSLRAEMAPTMFVPLAQQTDLGPSISVGVRVAGGPPMAVARSLADALQREDPTAALSFHSLEDQVNASLTQERLVATLSAFFGGLALLLAGVGLYGVTAYAVNARRVEIGIRMALGATATGVVRMILRRVGWLVIAGVAIGGGLSVWASRYIAALLYGLQPFDPATFAGAALLLAAVGALAGWLPARRAARVDPMIALRDG